MRQQVGSLRIKRFIFPLALVLVFLVAAAAMAERLAVSSSVANIRSGPGKNFPVIWKAQKYYPLSVFEKSGEWLNFNDFEGRVGWIHRSLVSDLPTVITKSTKCNIRRGPSGSRGISATIGKGVPFRVIERKGDWINVQHAGGFAGWIHVSLVW